MAKRPWQIFEHGDAEWFAEADRDEVLTHLEETIRDPRLDGVQLMMIGAFADLVLSEDGFFHTWLFCQLLTMATNPRRGGE